MVGWSEGGGEVVDSAPARLPSLNPYGDSNQTESKAGQ